MERSKHEEWVEKGIFFLQFSIAHLMIVGLLGIGFVGLLGFVDISNPTISAFLASIFTAVGIKIEPIIFKLFGRRTSEGGMIEDDKHDLSPKKEQEAVVTQHVDNKPE